MNTLLWPPPTEFLHPPLSTFYLDVLPKKGKYSKEGLCSSLGNQLLSPLLTWFRALSNMCAHLLAKMDHSMGAHGRLLTQIMGWLPLCFSLPRNLPGHVHLGKFSWPQEWQMWSSYIFIPAEFSSFILGVPGKTKFHFILLDKLQLFSSGDHLLPMSSRSILPCPFFFPNLKHPFLSLQSKFHFVFIVFPSSGLPNLSP